MAQQNSIQLGDTVKDTITGVMGVVVSISNWLNGCQTLQVQPTHLKDGVPVDRIPFDVEQVELVSRRVTPKTERHTGGDAQRVRSGRE